MFTVYCHSISRAQESLSFNRCTIISYLLFYQLEFLTVLHLLNFWTMLFLNLEDKVNLPLEELLISKFYVKIVLSVIKSYAGNRRISYLEAVTDISSSFNNFILGSESYVFLTFDQLQFPD